MAHDVFISYAHDDRTVANAVVATLEAHSIRCWIAPRDILPGEDWSSAIIDAIKEAHALVLIFSSHSNESEQIKREVERTVHQGIAVIPFRIEDVLPSKTLEFFISTQHWLDALTPPLEDHLSHLADTITVLLAKKGLREKTPRIGGEEPAPPRPEKPPEGPPPEPPPAKTVSGLPWKFPSTWLLPLVGLLVVIMVAGGIWWRWSQPVVSTKVAPVFAPKTPGSYKAPALYPPTNIVYPPPNLSADEYYNLGNEATYALQKIIYYSKAIEMNPYNAQYYYFRGFAHNASYEFPQAIGDFGKAVTYQPNYPTAYVGRGDAYSAMGQYDPAIVDYTKALSLEPDDPFTYVKRGHAFFKKGDNDKALADYSEAIKLLPNYATAFYSRGAVYGRRGENAEALADYNEAIRLDPKYVLAYMGRATLYEKMGDNEHAAEDRNKASALDPKGLMRSFRGQQSQRPRKPE